MKKTLIAAGCVSTGLLLATAAGAAPLGGMASPALPADASLVHKTHNGNTHRACMLGPGGWHYHSRWRGRVACRPPKPDRFWIWRKGDGREGWWHPKEKRWH